MANSKKPRNDKLSILLGFTTVAIAMPSALIMLGFVVGLITAVFLTINTLASITGFFLGLSLWTLPYVAIGMIFYAVIGILAAKRSVKEGRSGEGLLLTNYSIITLIAVSGVLLVASGNPYAGFTITPIVAIPLFTLIVISIRLSLRLLQR